MANNDNVFNFIDEALVDNPESDIVIPNSAKKSFRMEKKLNINLQGKTAKHAIDKAQQLKINSDSNPKSQKQLVNETSHRKRKITVSNDIVKEVDGYMESNGFNRKDIGSSEMFAVIPPDKSSLNSDFNPNVVSREDTLTFDYFPKISLDKISVENIQHTEETAKAAREKQEKLAKEQTEEELEKKRLSIGFVLSIIGLLVFFLTIPAVIISRSEMRKGRRKAKAGFILGIIGLILFVIEALAIAFLIIKFGLFI